MNNLKIDKELEEQYLDASVALFMDQYVQLLSQKLDQEMENDNDYVELIYPESLDQRCRQLIKDEHTRIRRKKRLVTAKKVLNRAAIIVVAFLALGSVLFMTVDAIRIPIMNFFVEKQRDSWHITGALQDTTKVESSGLSAIDFSNAYANRIPREYELTEILEDSEETFVGIFGNSLGQEIRFSVNPAGASIRVDSENADIAKDILVCNYPGVLLVEDEYCRLVWHQDEALIGIVSKNMGHESVLSLAEVIARPSK